MKKILLCILIMITCAMTFLACSKEESESTSKNIEFTQSEITLEVGENLKPEIITAQKNVYVMFSVADETVATVADDGTITALKEGQTICYAQFKGETAVCIIKVVKKQAKPELSVSVPYEDNQVVIFVGDSIDLESTAKMGSDEVNADQIEYVVANTQIVTVVEGKLQGVSAGVTTVTIKVTSGEKTAQITITVEVVED